MNSDEPPRPSPSAPSPTSIERPILARRAAVILGGTIYALGHIGFGVWPLLCVSLIPLWWSLEGLSPRASALQGLLFGVAAYAVGFPWLLALSQHFLEGDALFGFFLWALYGLWFAAGFALVALLFRRTIGSGRSAAVSGAIALVLVEWLYPLLFTAPTGSALIHVLPLAQSAELGGPLLLSAGIAATNGVLYGVWRKEPKHLAFGTPPQRLARLLVVVVALFVAGAMRIEFLERAAAREEPFEVGLVQGNLGLDEKRSASIRGHRKYVAQTRELLLPSKPDLLVWPETAYVGALRRPLPIDGQLILDALPGPLLFGANSVSEQGGKRIASNSAFLVNHEGMIRDVYDKNRLIPIAETIPFASIWPSLTGHFPHAQQFKASRELSPLRLGLFRIASPICYEITEPAFIRKLVRATSPHFLVTIANDAWFGDTQEPQIHLDLARMRAIEHRLWIARAANSGISAFISPTGKIAQRTKFNTRENLRGTLRLRQPRTLYGRLGDWPGGLALASLLTALVFPRRLLNG